MSQELFCNWDLDNVNEKSIDLLNLPPLEDYKIIFFDPINFALSNGLHENNVDLWDKAYIQYSEREYHEYLKHINKTRDQLREFFNSGGILVTRLTFPNTYITVRKKSQSSMKQYTSSVTSPFFWLEEFLGKFSFNYGSEFKMKFLDKRNVLNEFFQKTSIACLQTLSSTQRGQIQVIANNNKKPAFPVITKIALQSGKGEIYFIPKFLVKDEKSRLIDAFTAIRSGRQAKELKPGWLSYYEQELEMANPNINAIDDINREIEKLEKRRKTLMKRNDEVKDFVYLLYKSEEELQTIVRKAFKYMGFFFPDMPPAIEKAGFDFYARDNDIFHIVGKVYSTVNGPIGLTELEHFEAKIESACQSNKRFGILIANPDILSAPKRRNKWFSDELLEKNRKLGYCLVTSEQLFYIVHYLITKSDSDIKKEISQSLRRDILGCHSIFTLNRRKYLAPV